MSGAVLSDGILVLNHMLPFTGYPYEGRKVACPVCASSDSAQISGTDRRLKRLPTAVCHGCGLLFTNPMPTAEELEVYYRRYYRFDYQWAVAKPSARHVRKRSVQARQRVDAVKDLLSPGAVTLDFGTGSGEFVAAMLDDGFDAYGFEPGSDYSNFANKRLGDRISQGRWQDQNHDAAFDLVTSFHVFEHLNEPGAAFAAAAKWVKPGGLVFIETPDAMEQLQSKGFASLHFAHVIGFNRHNLELAAARAGLRLERVVSPTSLIFRREAPVTATETLARSGAALAQETLAEHGPGRAFLRYHLRKVGIR